MTMNNNNSSDNKWQPWPPEAKRMARTALDLTRQPWAVTGQTTSSSTSSSSGGVASNNNGYRHPTLSELGDKTGVEEIVERMVALLLIRMVALVTSRLGNAVVPQPKTNTSINVGGNGNTNSSGGSTANKGGSRKRQKIYSDYSTTTICRVALGLDQTNNNNNNEEEESSVKEEGVPLKEGGNNSNNGKAQHQNGEFQLSKQMVEDSKESFAPPDLTRHYSEPINKQAHYQRYHEHHHRRTSLDNSDTPTLSNKNPPPPPSSPSSDLFPAQITPEVIKQLRHYCSLICNQYAVPSKIPYHNVEHAYHVFLSANKLLDLVLCETPEAHDEPEEAEGGESEEVGDWEMRNSHNYNRNSQTGSSSSWRASLSGSHRLSTQTTHSSTTIRRRGRRRGTIETSRPSLITSNSQGGSEGGNVVQRPTFGIKSDPLAQLAFLFSALVHDVDHTGISNRQLVLEMDDLAILYNDQSVAEQRSLAVAFSCIKRDCYEELREVLFPRTVPVTPTAVGGASGGNTAGTGAGEAKPPPPPPPPPNPAAFGNEDFFKFRKLVIDLVLVTDIASPERTQIVKSKWKEAFGEVIVAEKMRKSVSMKNVMGSVSMSKRGSGGSCSRRSSSKSGGSGETGGGESESRPPASVVDTKGNSRRASVDKGSSGSKSKKGSRRASVDSKGSASNRGREGYNLGRRASMDSECSRSSSVASSLGGGKYEPTKRRSSVISENSSPGRRISGDIAAANDTGNDKNDGVALAPTAVTAGSATQATTGSGTTSRGPRLVGMRPKFKRGDSSHSIGSSNKGSDGRLGRGDSSRSMNSKGKAHKRASSEGNTGSRPIRRMSSELRESLATDADSTFRDSLLDCDSIEFSDTSDDDTASSAPSESLSDMQSEDDFDASAVSRTKMDFTERFNGSSYSNNSSEVFSSINSASSGGGGAEGAANKMPMLAEAPLEDEKGESAAASAGAKTNSGGIGSGSGGSNNRTLRILQRWSTGDLVEDADSISGNEEDDNEERGGTVGMTQRQLREKQQQQQELQPSKKAHRRASQESQEEDTFRPATIGFKATSASIVPKSFSMSVNNNTQGSPDSNHRRRKSSMARVTGGLSQSMLTPHELRRARPRAHSEERRLGVRRALDLAGSTIVAYSGLRGSTSSNEPNMGDLAGGGAGEGWEEELDPEDDIDEFKATVVLEQLIRAADVAALLQSWENKLRWSTRLYKELKNGHLQNRGEDPSVGWFENQIKFFDFYILPLAKNLGVMGVFTEEVGSHFVYCVKANLARWIEEGSRATELMMREDEECRRKEAEKQVREMEEQEQRRKQEEEEEQQRLQQEEEQKLRQQQEPEGNRIESLSEQISNSLNVSGGGSSSTPASVTFATTGGGSNNIGTSHHSLNSSFRSCASNTSFASTSTNNSNNSNINVSSQGGGGSTTSGSARRKNSSSNSRTGRRRLVKGTSLEVGEACVVCGVVGRYTCPVCSSPYCSVKCCQEHKASGCS